GRTNAAGVLEFFNFSNSTWETVPTAGQNFQISTSLNDIGNPVKEWTNTTVIPAGLFTDGWRYNVESKATDFAGNFETAFNPATFIVDASSPTTTIVYPSSGAYVSQTGFLQGNTTDAVVAPGNTPSGIAKVYVRISTSNYTSFWDGATWVSSTN